VVGALGAIDAGPELVVPRDEGDVRLTTDRLHVARTRKTDTPINAANAGWRSRYILGKELGAGQTAIVYEAFAVNPGSSREVPAAAKSSASGAPPPGAVGRRVALKKFNLKGTTMFNQEVKVLGQSGVHPHVLRLLESFDGGTEEDALVLEYCEGGDVYELYAQGNGRGMSESFVVQLIRQLLLALDHLMRKGVEHRDVKPENLLLYGNSYEEAVPHLKLADFGWASIAKAGKQASVPPEGVGSLWYAPPELNPPVQGIPPQNNGPVPLGKSDMWSVGIITYLLLVGHSPFNHALRVSDPQAREGEVLRLAALGQINTSTKAFTRLSQDAHSFIASLLKPTGSDRITAVQAWAHPFLTRLNGRPGQDSATPQAWSLAERRTSWERLDGFQRLCWLAAARAVSEPELDGRVVEVLSSKQKMESSGACGGDGYLDQLAVELATTAQPSWFQQGTAWADVLQLAFRYIDIDADGELDIDDLASHILSDNAREAANVWVVRWMRAPREASGCMHQGLSFADFHGALQSIACRHQPTANSPGEAGFYPHLADDEDLRKELARLGGEGERGDTWPNLVEEAAMQLRLHAIDEGLLRFIHEEPVMHFGDSAE